MKKLKHSWVSGHHAIKAIIENAPERILAVYLVENSQNTIQAELIAKFRALGISIQKTDKADLKLKIGSEKHQGIAIQVKPKAEATESQFYAVVDKLLENDSHAPLILILDQVQDPHNFGACLRTADASGVDAVLVAKDNACPLTPVVQKVASGAAETMDIYRVPNLARSMQWLKKRGVWILGTSDKASHSIFKQDLKGPIAIVMGAEGKGLRPLTEKNCDTLMNIPMSGSIVSSLNVSVATGVCLYEAVRQRND